MALKMFGLGKDDDSDKLDTSRLPVHIALIMDGNGRWAKNRMMPRLVGHRQGMETLKSIIKCASTIGIKHLTFYTFSTENWKRSEEEVNGLMELLVIYLRSEIDELHKNNVKLNFIGFIEELPELQREEIAKAMYITENNTGLNVHLAVNYGSRPEILNGVKRIAKEAAAGRWSQEEIEAIDGNFFEKYLMTSSIPDPDLMIRTGGEKRLSNYLLYQLSYSEFSFIDVLWPDFTDKDFIDEIILFQNRNRRFGAV